MLLEQMGVYISMLNEENGFFSVFCGVFFDPVMLPHVEIDEYRGSAKQLAVGSLTSVAYV